MPPRQSRRRLFIGGAILTGIILLIAGFVAWQRFGSPGQGSADGRFRDNPFTTGDVELKTCIRQAIGNQAFEEIAKGKRRPTAEESQSVDKCGRQKRLARQEREESSGDNPFVAGSEKLKACIRETIGAEAFAAIAGGKRQPTSEEARAVGACGQRERPAGRQQERVDFEFEERCLKEGLGSDYERVLRSGYPTFAQQKVIAECRIQFYDMLEKARKEAQAQYVKAHPDVARRKMTFEVTVPENTPPEDRIYLTAFLTINARGDMLRWAMKKVGPRTWRVAIPAANLGPAIENPEGEIYFYSRNGRDYVTAEALPGDPDPEFAEKEGFGRRMRWRAGATQRDTVARWRWLPAPGEPREKMPPLPEPAAIQPRVGGMVFRSGQTLEDYYYPFMENFFDSTARHLKAHGYEWVTLIPGWDFVNEDPPKLALPETVWPGVSLQYPDDEMIKRNIRALKGAGLKVKFAPQVCCIIVDKTNRSSAWYNQYLNELAKMNLRFARMAQKTGVDAFLIEADFETLRRAPNHPRWQTILEEVQGEFSGEVGVSFKVPDDLNVLLAVAGRYPWIRELDFFVYPVLGTLSQSSPTDAQLTAWAGRELDRAKVVFERFGKPVWPVVFHISAKESWRYADPASEIALALHRPEKRLREHGVEISEADQARVVAAFFEAVKTRPWIMGLESFSYSHMDMTRLPSADVRNKLAEDVWERWNRYLKTVSAE